MKKLQFHLSKKGFFKSGGSMYTICLPTHIMQAYGWERDKDLEITISPNEVMIRKKETSE